MTEDAGGAPPAGVYSALRALSCVADERCGAVAGRAAAPHPGVAGARGVLARRRHRPALVPCRRTAFGSRSDRSGEPPHGRAVSVARGFEARARWRQCRSTWPRYRISPPGWFATAGWSLSPGNGWPGARRAHGARSSPDRSVRAPSSRSHHDPDRRDAPGSAAEPALTLTADLDGAAIETWGFAPSAPGQSFLQVLDLPSGIPDGPGAYARLRLTARSNTRGPDHPGGGDSTVRRAVGASDAGLRRWLVSGRSGRGDRTPLALDERSIDGAHRGGRRRVPSASRRIADESTMTRRHGSGSWPAIGCWPSTTPMRISHGGCLTGRCARGIGRNDRDRHGPCAPARSGRRHERHAPSRITDLRVCDRARECARSTLALIDTRRIGR